MTNPKIENIFLRFFWHTPIIPKINPVKLDNMAAMTNKPVTTMPLYDSPSAANTLTIVIIKNITVVAAAIKDSINEATPNPECLAVLLAFVAVLFMFFSAGIN